jgi:hypothetical protein
MNLLLLVVAGSVIVTTPAERYWWLAPSVAAIAACLVFWVNWCRPYLREQRMKRPFRALMVGPPRPIGDRMVNELTAPPDSEFSIQMSIVPRIDYEQHDVVFGFFGDQEHRPIPIRGFNEFIKTGKRRDQSPENNENHFIDENDNYHIRETRTLTKGNAYRAGYLVQTREPGCYPIRLEVITECGDGCSMNGLFLIVEPRRID